MNEQRSHGQNPAVRNETVNWWHLNRELLDLLVTQYSKSVGSRQDAKWPVFRIARIEVNPQSEHLIQRPSRSMRAIKVPKHWCDFHCRKRVGYGGEASSLKLLLPHDISPQH